MELERENDDNDEDLRDAAKDRNHVIQPSTHEPSNVCCVMYAPHSLLRIALINPSVASVLSLLTLSLSQLL